MIDRARSWIRTLLLVALFLASSLALGHSASRGLHLHVTPEPARLGGKIKVVVNSADPMARLRIAFVGRPPIEIEPRRPKRRRTIRMRVPDRTAGETVNLQAEAETVTGKIVRASAIVPVVQVDRISLDTRSSSVRYCWRNGRFGS